MLKLVGGRVLGAVTTLLLASALAFFVLRLLPGDSARLIAGPLADAETVAAVRRGLGLDQPMVIQFLTYLRDFFTGDWGFSFGAGQDVATVFADRLPATIELALFAFVLSAGGAILLAVVASYRGGGWRALLHAGSIVGMGTPPFWIALLALLVFSQFLGWFPGPSEVISRGVTPPETVTGFVTVDALLEGRIDVTIDAIWHLFLPAACLALLSWAFLVRLLNANMEESKRDPYVTVVRSKGVSSWSTHWRHVLHNASLPSFTASGLVLAQLITGSVLVEKVFDWPGVGSLVVESILRQDFAVVQVFIMLSAVLFIVTNLLVDILGAFLDPRTRRQGAKT